MNLATFDLYWKEETNNHGINIYDQVFFDWKKIISFKPKVAKQTNINTLVNVLNKVTFRASHNFNWYDWWRLKLLKSHSKWNIDTLIIDTLFDFDKAHHKLNKSQNNNPLEDANSTFLVLEKNIKTFFNFDESSQSIIYSLLLDYDEYNDFFFFYEKLISKKIIVLNKYEIIGKIKNILFKKWIWEFNFDFNIFFKNNNSKLALVYLILFLEKQKIVLPDFIYKNNIELREILRDTLNIFYKSFWGYFNKNKLAYLRDFYSDNNAEFRWTIQEKWVELSFKNKDILDILWTWWWKSLIYQLPAKIIWEKTWALTLVITPLKALIKDQIDWLNRKWFNEVKHLSWDQSNIEKDLIKDKIKSWETKLLFLTPEWLRTESNFDFLKNRYISRIVVDEAHTLILWWWEFRPDYFFIKNFLSDLEEKNLNKNINITLLTATAPVDVETWLISYFSNRKIEIIKQENTLKDNIKPSVINITNKKDRKKELLVQKLKDINIEKYPTIIFTWRRNNAEELVLLLEKEWIKSEFFHAWMYSK